jgi:hypothetical protein
MIVDVDYKKLSGETETYQVLVIDPNKLNEHTGNSQLHGVLVDDLHDNSLIELTIKMGKFYYDPSNRRNPLTDLKTDDAYEKFKEHYGGKVRYRTFLIDNITSARQRLVGMPSGYSGPTKKVKIGNSVLYGVEHEKYVLINEDDWHELILELKSVDYCTYYEGTNGHELPTLQLLNLLDSDQNYKGKSKSWDIGDPQVLELFGGNPGPMWNAITKKIKEEKIDIEGKTLMEVLAITSGQTGKNWWTRTKITESEIENYVRMATSGVRNAPSLQYNSTLYKEFTEVEFSEFEQFKKEMMVVAFASNEGADGKPYIGNELERITSEANLGRDTHLKYLMETEPGVYFAGHSHVDDIKKL